jgi:tRNA G10  N-methylase Trm11
VKFDVVVGNPPYQSSTGSLGGGGTPLYIRFVQKCQELLSVDGHLALVTPPTAFKIGMGGVNARIITNNLVAMGLKNGRDFKIDPVNAILKIMGKERKI